MGNIARYRLVLQTTLVSQFAKGAASPSRAMAYRLAAAYIFCGVMASVLRSSIQRADVPVDVPLRLTVALVILIGFMTSGLLFLTFHGALSAQVSQKSLFRTLAIPRFVRLICTIAPSIAALGTLMVGGCLFLAELARAMQLPGVVICAGWIVGLMSGHGLVLAVKPRQLSVKVVWFMVVIATSFKLIEWLFTAQWQPAVSIGSYTICGLAGLPLTGYLQHYRWGYSVQDVHAIPVSRAMLPNFLPYSWWFILKLVRSRRSRQSFLLVLGVSSAIASTIVLRKITVPQPLLLLQIPALLAATFACDIRGLSRRYIPGEMMLFGSLRTFIKTQLWAVVLAAWLIGLPVVYAVHPQVSSSLSFLLMYLIVQSFAAVVGLLASTLFVPHAGEVGAQLFAALFVTSFLTGLPRIMPQISFDQPAAGRLSLLISVLCIVAGMSIETIRRKRYGRS